MDESYAVSFMKISKKIVVFAEKYRADLKRLPASYRRAIASVELASRIVYRLGDPATEIRAVL